MPTPPPDAIAAFIACHDEVNRLLDRLQALNESHYGYSPTDVTWRDVGAVADIVAKLRHVVAVAAHEDEHEESHAPQARAWLN